MTDRLEPIESLLLDHHLRRLDPQQESRVHEALAESPELAAQSRGLEEVLGLLDRHQAPEPPAELANSVLARVDAQTAVLPFRAPSSAVPAGTAHDLSASPVLSLRELIAIAACITLFVGIFVPGYYKAQSIAKRNRCLDNQRQIWAGMASFAQANDGHISRAEFVPGGSWLPTRVPNVRRVSNTAYIFRLVRQGHVRDTLVFICPEARNARPMLADDYDKFDDFAEAANNTYSYMFNNVPKSRRLADLSTVEKALNRYSKAAKSGNDKEAAKIVSLLTPIQAALNEGKPARTVEVSKEEQIGLHDSIYNVEWGIKATGMVPSERARANFEKYTKTLAEAGAEVIILGCTEIPLALPEPQLYQIPFINPMAELAKALVHKSS